MKKLIAIFLLSIPLACFGQQVYETTSGVVRFHSDAPQELIKASSNQLKGIIDIRKKTFAFRVGISSFLGFNSPLQREHFNENYMETSFFPEASFSGKIIEEIDLSRDGEYVIRAKGKMKIHGVEQERIIRSLVVRKNGKISIQSDFIVLLADHSIKIPRLVSEKLSPEINVSVNANFVQKNQ